MLSRTDMGTDKNPFNQLCNQVIVIKSLSLGRYHCVTASSVSRSFECLLEVGWNACVAQLQASQAGFMALWETKQGMQYESSIFSLQTGLNTT